jgi:hypothetical protein
LAQAGRAQSIERRTFGQAHQIRDRDLGRATAGTPDPSRGDDR